MSFINMLPVLRTHTRAYSVPGSRAVCGLLILLNARTECLPEEQAALCSSAGGIYSLFYSCSSSPDWLWQGGDEGEELFSSAGSSIIPVTPNRQKESSRGNLPSVSSGEERGRRGEGGMDGGGRGRKKKKKKLLILKSSSSTVILTFSLFFIW